MQRRESQDLVESKKVTRHFIIVDVTDGTNSLTTLFYNCHAYGEKHKCLEIVDNKLPQET